MTEALLVPGQSWSGGGVLTRPEMVAAGATDAEISRMRRTGTLVPLQRGIYLPRAVADGFGPERRHVSLLRGSVPQLAPGAVVSHVSAALLYGLPVWSMALDRVHVTRPILSGGARTPGLHIHTTNRIPVPHTVVDGFLTTTAALTVVDIARTTAFEQGVVVADAALRCGLVRREELADEVELAKRRQGARRAKAVVEFADGLSESVGESRSRVRLWRGGIVGITLQHEIRDGTGELVARSDFAIPSLRIAGEFDGKVKYGRLLKPSQQPGEVVFNEKIREDAVRGLGWTMVRWIWDDLDAFDAVIERWNRAIHSAGAR